LQPDIKDFIKKVKEIGYCVKIDTNGSNPQGLEELLSENLLDYIAMDYKAPIEKYASVVRVNINKDVIKKTLMTIVKSGILYETRTTLFQGLANSDVLKMMEELKTYGVENYYLQMPISKNTYNIDIPLLFENLKKNFKQYGIRNLRV
jgi:pyruvate formate lyase activating enzyme